MRVVWDQDAWSDYLWWPPQDRRRLCRINPLIQDIQRSGNDGIGKPDALGYGLHGYWSRRITHEHY